MGKCVLDTLEFDTFNGEEPDICLVRGTIYLIVYEGPNYDLWACTVSIDSNGVISLLDSLELTTINQSNCLARVIKLSAGYAAIVYKGDGGDGYLMTVSVDVSGNISVVDSWEFETSSCGCPFIMHISGTTYAIAYYRYPASNNLFTVTISDVGVITKSKIDTLTLGISSNQGIQGIHVSGDIWAFAYSSGGVSIQTVEIDSAGNIGAAVIDTFSFGESQTFAWPMLTHVYGTIYAAVYRAGAVGYFYPIKLSTIEIQNDGTIVGEVDESIIFGYGAFPPNIGLYDTNVFLITYQQTTSVYGTLRAVTIAIADDGTIGAIDESAFIGFSYWQRQIETATSKIWAVIYKGAGNDGFICTMGVLPTVTTQAVTDITGSTATGNGNIADLGIPNVIQHGHCWNTSGYPDINDDKTELGVPGGVGAFTSNLTVLTKGTLYYVRAYAINGDKVAYGDEVEFITIDTPTVTTDPATEVEETTATLNGTLDNDGGEACDCGFEWGETIAYGNTTPAQSRTTGQIFAQTVTGLDPDKTYHFRAFATNVAGTSYGSDMTFKTLTPLLIVTTNPATELGAISATLNGTLDNDGGEACDCGFEWGLDIGYGHFTSTEKKRTSETFSEVIGELQPGTTYHFRAFASSSQGTGYGADRTFRTEAELVQSYFPPELQLLLEE